MTPSEIKRFAYNHYIHTDSSMNLRANSGRVDNNNGSLYLAFFLELLDQCGILDASDRINARRCIKIIEIEPGLYMKQSDDPKLLNSHDNRIGITSIQSLGCGEYATDTCNYGEAHGWGFDNTKQEVTPLKAYDQLGEVAYYKIMAERVPNLLELFWLAFGLIVSGCVNRVPSWHLSWLRVQGLRREVVKQFKVKQWIVVNVVVILACFIFDCLMVARFKSRLYPVYRYYADPNHPNKLLALALEEMNRGKNR